MSTTAHTHTRLRYRSYTMYILYNIIHSWDFNRMHSLKHREKANLWISNANALLAPHIKHIRKSVVWTVNWEKDRKFMNKCKNTLRNIELWDNTHSKKKYEDRMHYSILFVIRCVAVAAASVSSDTKKHSPFSMYFPTIIIFIYVPSTHGWVLESWL